MSDQDTDRSQPDDPPPPPTTVVGEIKPAPVVAHNVWVGISRGDLILAHFFADHYAPPERWVIRRHEGNIVTQIPDDLHVVREYVATLVIPSSHVRDIAARLTAAADAIDSAHAATSAQEVEAPDE